MLDLCAPVPADCLGVAGQGRSDAVVVHSQPYRLPSSPRGPHLPRLRWAPKNLGAEPLIAVQGHYLGFPRAGREMGGKWPVPAAALLSAEGNAGPAAPPGPGADLFLYVVRAAQTRTVCKGRAGSCPGPRPPCQQGLPLLVPHPQVLLVPPRVGRDRQGRAGTAVRPCLRALRQGSGLSRKLRPARMVLSRAWGPPLLRQQPLLPSWR